MIFVGRPVGGRALAAFVFAAFVDHPLDSVVGDEVLVGDPDEFQIAAPRFSAQGRLRQPATEEQLASVIKSNGIVIPDINRRCHLSSAFLVRSLSC